MLHHIMFEYSRVLLRQLFSVSITFVTQYVWFTNVTMLEYY